ncbi:hypothetical protein [Haloplasma contractile]|uniref:Uncharacterized protein n=1 Tax=Haloplasma contractile SSD-17B TaxID=1033810 RepID=F7PVR5_9MOLU|nr:hypothetical protein [Haloplasma contractile]ERJ12764.1 hypothetical protein HLPCO_001104 [Haloplasma contractile SSD-17B]
MLKLNLSISSKKTSLFLLVFIALTFVVEPLKYYAFDELFELSFESNFSELLTLFVITFKIISALFALVYLFKVELDDNREKVIYKIISLWIIQCLLYYHLFDLFIFDTSKYVYFIISVLFVHLIILLLISWRVNDHFDLTQHNLKYNVAFTKKDVLSFILSIMLIYFISFIVCDVSSLEPKGITYHFVLSSVAAIFPMIINNKIIVLIKYMYDNINI